MNFALLITTQFCMQTAVYLVKTHLLLYNNKSASLKLHFKQYKTLGLLKTTGYLAETIPCRCIFYVYFVSDFTTIFK